jgi:hypothetical protein
MKHLSKIVRTITVAPVMALAMLLTLFLHNPLLFGTPAHFALSILFLVIFPLLAYPSQPLIKKYKEKGRDGQRALAIDFAVAGYIGGFLSAVVFDAPRQVWIIYLTYLCSGILIMLLNKLLHLKASGHACGVVGPFAILICFGQRLGYWGIAVLALVWWSSLYMKRHTTMQLIGGAVIPIVSLAIVMAMCSIACPV